MDYQPPYTLTPDIVSLVVAVADVVTVKLDVRDLPAAQGSAQAGAAAEVDEVQSSMGDWGAAEEGVAVEQGGHDGG